MGIHTPDLCRAKDSKTNHVNLLFSGTRQKNIWLPIKIINKVVCGQINSKRVEDTQFSRLIQVHKSKYNLVNCQERRN